jgi:hypothetical protein
MDQKLLFADQGRHRKSLQRCLGHLRNAQRRQAEYDRLAALVFPWPGPQIPSVFKLARDMRRFGDRKRNHIYLLGPHRGRAPSGLIVYGIPESVPSSAAFRSACFILSRPAAQAAPSRPPALTPDRRTSEPPACSCEPTDSGKAWLSRRREPAGAMMTSKSLPLHLLFLFCLGRLWLGHRFCRASGRRRGRVGARLCRSTSAGTARTTCLGHGPGSG